MSLELYNSLTRRKEQFNPLEKNKVSLYVCGITPNNAAHLGHAFTYVSFDILVRYLRYKKYHVTYLQNATDINDSDDVIKQAKAAGRTWDEEAQFWIRHFHEQMDQLLVLRPNEYVLATSVIPQIIEIIKKLINKGFAYEKNGSVYFDIHSFKTYGALSKYTNEQMLFISRERGNNPDDPNKKSPLDFVLWFGDEKNPNWESPWGRGRPGWHIECSTMIDSILGLRIDIHGGGRDLIYPHHESEIAQSESASGKSPFVNVWMHTSMVLCEGEKMSKSLGNLVLVSDLLKKYSPFAIRYLLLSHHYRNPWEFEEFDLNQIEMKVTRIKNLLKNTDNNTQDEINVRKFEEIMEDDLNTPFVLGFIDELISEEKLGDTRKIFELLGFNFD